MNALTLLKARKQDKRITPEVRGQARQMSAADAGRGGGFPPSTSTALLLHWEKSGCHGDPDVSGQPNSLPAITVFSLPCWARRAAEKTAVRRKRLFPPLSSANNHYSCCLQ